MSGEPLRVRPSAAQVAAAAVVLLAAALLVAPWRAHVDDMDAQCYRVVAAEAAARGAWFDLSFLPGYWQQFREHLPFGFWPSIALLRLGGGAGLLDGLALAFSLGTLALAMAAAHRLSGPLAGLAAGLTLATTEAFWHYGARPLLEPQLFLFSTGAALTWLLAPSIGPRAFAVAALCGAAAVATKGPFGLIALAGAVAARAISERSWARLLQGALCSAAACAPTALFLAADGAWLGGSWWRTYVLGKLVAWTTGARPVGVHEWWYPPDIVARRFWPGNALLLLGIAAWPGRPQGDRGPIARLALACAFALAALCVPADKWGNHTYVVFPLLAVLAGALVGPWLEARLAAAGFRRLAAGLLVAAGAAWAASLAGAGRLVQRPPCVLAAELAPLLDPLPAGEAVLVLEEGDSFEMLALLAAERGLIGWPARSLPAGAPEGPPGSEASARVALSRLSGNPGEGWRLLRQARGWTLLSREAVPARSARSEGRP